MTPDRHILIKQIFLEAVALSPDDREALLTNRCQQDAKLANEVRHLLAHHQPSETVAGHRPSVEAVALSLAETSMENPHPAKRAQERTPADLIPAFPSGSIVGRRYRIVTQVGRGGWAVVYRAEDLVLRQTIALKFLSPLLMTDAQGITRVRNEVRFTRKIVHPNVCRVYDLNAADGFYFLSMELIDGENLAALMKQIGRLAPEKAQDVARQACIGLAAAHGRGIIHRDLKPANIMIDAQGRVRIMDFGLAVNLGESKGPDIRSGTPAYMAPEQTAGLEVTLRSDVYSLGLLLREIFAGQVLGEAISASQAEIPANQSLSHRAEEVVPPEIRGIVDRCLQRRPSARPSSALEVAAMLPGLDVLSAAQAANVTPSAQTIASFRSATTPRLGYLWLAAATVVLLAGVVVGRNLFPKTWERAHTKPVGALVERAREAAGFAGFSSVERDEARGFCALAEVGDFVGHGLRQAEESLAIAPTWDEPFLFWYRLGPRGTLVPSSGENFVFGPGRTTLRDPPPDMSSEVLVLLAPSGQLLYLWAGFAAKRNAASTNEDRTDTGSGRPLRYLAGLDETSLSPVETPIQPNQGKETFFRQIVLGDPAKRVVWSKNESAANQPFLFAVVNDRVGPNSAPTIAPSLQLILLRSLLAFAILVAVPLAFFNERNGRVDRQGVLRFSAFVLVVQLVIRFLRSTIPLEFGSFVNALCVGSVLSFGTAATLGVFYAALEPAARRYWPRMMITWSRMLRGCFRDSLVGFHLVLGSCVGCFWALLNFAESSLLSSWGRAGAGAGVNDRVLQAMVGGRIALAGFANTLLRSMFIGFVAGILLALAFRVTRNRTAAALVTIGAFGLLAIPADVYVGMGLITSTIGMWAVAVALLVRGGIAALCAALFVASMLIETPLLLGSGAPGSEQGILAIAVVTAVTLVGLYLARTPQDVFATQSAVD